MQIKIDKVVFLEHVHSCSPGLIFFSSAVLTPAQACLSFIDRVN